MDNREKTAPVQPESSRGYTIDELLAQMEPQYRAYKTTIRECIAGLTDYAAQLAAQGREEQLPQFRRLCIEMAEFWGLTDDETLKGYQEMAQKYGDAFDHAVSASKSSGDAPELNDQARQDILHGLELYAKEMRANDDELEPWAAGCDILAESLKEQWKLETAAPQQTTQVMEGM